MTHHHDRAPGSSEDEPGDFGPPDWFAAVAEPEPEPEPEEEPEPGEEDRSEVPGELPGLIRASDLAAGRRRRRSAVAEETGEPYGLGPAVGVRASGGGAEAAEGSGRRGGRKRRDRGEAGEPGEGRRAGRGERARAAEETGDPAARARDICLRLLTGAAKTRKQLADALRKREIPDEVAEEVLSRFVEVGLIDDAAFAAAWVESRHAVRGLSRRALAQELRTKGVAGDLVEQAVAQVDVEDEESAARALADRKLRATRGLDRDVRIRRLVGMLARRGYGEGLAYRVVREALAEEGDGPDDSPDGPW